METDKRRSVLIVGGTGYLGQHLLQGFTQILHSLPFPLFLGFTYHSNPPPQPLLDAAPQSVPFPLDLRTGIGFDSISQTLGQVRSFNFPSR
ncbi:unnamed protein product [Cuscuta campestris]|uniref:NAD-dependent epimerase/dehydratase domain-containing protein n=1 Tax=Cuscuta campestris TaxID=132261 RepID=A0A484LHX5_9ASTE|nr:unnamed protein product [Cuscuta campestris]